jgi:hypothetical protein
VASAAAGTSSPLTLVSRAVAGQDLGEVAASVHEALALPVAIAIPTLGEPVVWPHGSIDEDAVLAIVGQAAAVVDGSAGVMPDVIADAVPVRIGDEVVGLVAVARGGRPVELGPEHRTWLEAGAAAAAVTSLMRDAQEGGVGESRRTLLGQLRAGPPADVAAMVAHGRRLGFDLGSGAVGICAVPRPGATEDVAEDWLSRLPALLADIGGGKVCGLVPLSSPLPNGGAEAVAVELAEHELVVAVSSPRRDAAMLHDALQEAELLVALASSPDTALPGQEDTYRLLIGVMLRDPDELERLRAQTISQLVIYDAEHETELVATLQAFLAHDGSTTDTAEAMHLHRHTVGYRLARVHEVSGLSPYESDGRERLSLGLKSDHIIRAAAHLSE